jgi:hypothetical protein
VRVLEITDNVFILTYLSVDGCRLYLETAGDPHVVTRGK